MFEGNEDRRPNFEQGVDSLVNYMRTLKEGGKASELQAIEDSLTYALLVRRIRTELPPREAIPVGDVDDNDARGINIEARKKVAENFRIKMYERGLEDHIYQGEQEGRGESVVATALNFDTRVFVEGVIEKFGETDHPTGTPGVKTRPYGGG